MAAKSNFEVGFVFGAKKAATFDKAFGSVNKSISGITKGIVGMAGAYVSFNAIKDLTAKCVQEAKDMVAVETKLSAVLQNVVGIQEKGTDYYKQATSSLLKTADAYEKVGVIAADVTVAGMQQLATFQLTDAEIGILTEGMTDLLAQQKGLNASQQDGVAVGNMIGKVMGGQVGALSKVGITFDKAQEKALKFGTAQERATVLAEVLAQNVGGVNKALAETDDGQIKKVDDAWGAVRENIGRKILPLQAKFARATLTAMPAIEKAGTWAMDKIGVGIDWVLEKVDEFTPYIAEGVRAFENFKSTVTPIFDKLKSGISGAFTWIKDVATESFGKIQAVISENSEKFEAFGAAVKDVGGKVKDILEKGLEAVKPIIEWIATEGLPKVVDVLGEVTGKAAEFYGFITENWESVKSIVIDIGLAFAAWNLPNVLAGAVQGIMNFSALIRALPATLGKATVAQFALVKAKIADKVETLQLVGLYVKDFAVALWGNVKAVAASTGAWIANKAAMIGSKVATLALKGVQLVSTAVTTGMTVAQWALNAAFYASPIGWVVLGIGALIAIGVLLWKNWDTIKAKGMELWAGMKAVFSNIQTYFTGMVTSITSKFPLLATALSGPVETIKGIFNGMKTAFTGVIDFVSGVFTGNWQKAWEGVKGIFGGIFDSFAAMAKAPINGVIGIINAAIQGINGLKIDVPDWVPGIGGQTYAIAIPTIPMLAEGGIATTPTLAMVGEGKEKEAILPLSKLQGMLTQNDLSGVLSSFMAMVQQVLSTVSVGGGDSITFAPQLVFNGPADRDMVNTAMGEAYQEFKQMMVRYEQDKRRTAMRRG